MKYVNSIAIIDLLFSHCSVVTHLRCGGKYDMNLAANLLLSPTAKEFLSRVSTLTRDIDIHVAILSVCLSASNALVLSYENGLTYCHSFSPYGSPIILVLPA